MPATPFAPAPAEPSIVLAGSSAARRPESRAAADIDDTAPTPTSCFDGFIVAINTIRSRGQAARIAGAKPAGPTGLKFRSLRCVRSRCWGRFMQTGGIKETAGSGRNEQRLKYTWSTFRALRPLRTVRRGCGKSHDETRNIDLTWLTRANWVHLSQNRSILTGTAPLDMLCNEHECDLHYEQTPSGVSTPAHCPLLCATPLPTNYSSFCTLSHLAR